MHKGEPHSCPCGQSFHEELHDLWLSTGKTVLFVTHSIAEAAYLSTRIAVMAARPGRIHAIIDSDLPRERSPDSRNDPDFAALCARLRDALRDADAV